MIAFIVHLRVAELSDLPDACLPWPVGCLGLLAWACLPNAVADLTSMKGNIMDAMAEAVDGMRL